MPYAASPMICESFGKYSSGNVRNRATGEFRKTRESWTDPSCPAYTCVK